MRVFGGDSFKNILGKLGMQDDQPIENRMITKSLENAQEKIEGFNFDARKHVLEYDDVLNFQRKIMYAARRDVLLGSDDTVREYLRKTVGERFPEDLEKIEKIISSATTEQMKIIRGVILQTIDMFWVDHLEMMDYMRSSVNLRAYGQRDPLVEYKREGLTLFKNMEISITAEIVKLIPQIQAQSQVFFDAPRNLQEVSRPAAEVALPLAASPAISAPKNVTPNGHKIGRNDPCFCGSGKKYKHCHGK
jgi:preprotein translocase subunit SecA